MNIMWKIVHIQNVDYVHWIYLVFDIIWKIVCIKCIELWTFFEKNVYIEYTELYILKNCVRWIYKIVLIL